MVVTAAMSYYDDDLALLDRCLRSIPTVADRLVVCDGRYERYEPGGPAGSPPEHLDFIRDTCADIGLPVKIDTTDRVYAGQIEKRSRLLGLAVKGSDWIVGVDADHIFHGVRYTIRHELATTEAHALEAMYFTPMNHERPLRESAAGEWHAALAGDHALICAFWRAHPGMRVEQRHWWYSAEIDGVRHWVWAGDVRYPHAKTERLKAPLIVEHACLFRQERHIVANREFCKDRERIVKLTGQEDAVEAVAA